MLSKRDGHIMAAGPLCEGLSGADGSDLTAGSLPKGVDPALLDGTCRSCTQTSSHRGVHFSISGHTTRLAKRKTTPMLQKVPESP